MDLPFLSPVSPALARDMRSHFSALSGKYSFSKQVVYENRGHGRQPEVCCFPT